MNPREELIGLIWEEFSKCHDVKRRTDIMLALFARIPELDLYAIAEELGLSQTTVPQ